MHPAQTETTGQQASPFRESFKLSSTLGVWLRNAFKVTARVRALQKLSELNNHLLLDIGEEDLAREKMTAEGPHGVVSTGFEKSLLRRP